MGNKRLSHRSTGKITRRPYFHSVSKSPSGIFREKCQISALCGPVQSDVTVRGQSGIASSGDHGENASALTAAVWLRFVHLGAPVREG